MKRIEKKLPKRPPGRPEKPDAPERQAIGSRVQIELYEKLAAAAVDNRRTLSVEIERRLEQSFESEQAKPDDALQILDREFMAAFEAGGRLGSRIMDAQASGQREISPREWILDPSSYTEAASRALEVLADWHPKPHYGHCLIMIYALRARLDRAWHRLLQDMTFEEAKAEKKKAIELVETMRPTPSLLDPLFFPPKDAGQ